MDAHFNAYKCKYATLDSLIKPIIRSQNIKTINVYIDLDNIYHLLHRPLVNAEFQVIGRDAPLQLISNVLNLIAHYRQWVVRQKISCNVFCMFTTSYGNFKNNIYVSNYRQHFIDINRINNGEYFFINQAIRESNELLKVISQYIDGVYILDSKYMEPSAIPFWISNSIKRADWNLLVTRDIYTTQYATMGKFSVIVPKGDNSSFINESSLWEYILNKEKIILKQSIKISPAILFSIGIAIVGDKYRNIQRVRRIGWRTFFNHVEKMIDNNGEKSDITLRDELLDKILINDGIINKFNNNLFATVIQKQTDVMNEIDKNTIISQMLDIPDTENLMMMTRTKFDRYPINLKYLIDNSSRDPFSVK